MAENIKIICQQRLCNLPARRIPIVDRFSATYTSRTTRGRQARPGHKRASTIKEDPPSSRQRLRGVFSQNVCAMSVERGPAQMLSTLPSPWKP